MNYDAWAEWYDVFYSTAGVEDVAFYVELARASGGPVLEIGCGTGRVSLPIAAAGIDVLG
ncbi:MAG: class I SAM-dependent methyltransferase, partial [Chloroflexi bacterium]|nr:class I SAM-dependent methyltransferase [Chloroflexota bacterium]